MERVKLQTFKNSLNTNHKIAVVALILALVAVFMAPRLYYDYKIERCTESHVKVGKGTIDRDNAEAACHRFVHGSK